MSVYELPTTILREWQDSVSKDLTRIYVANLPMQTGMLKRVSVVFKLKGTNAFKQMVWFLRDGMKRHLLSTYFLTTGYLDEEQVAVDYTDPDADNANGKLMMYSAPETSFDIKLKPGMLIEWMATMGNVSQGNYNDIYPPLMVIVVNDEGT